MTTRVIQRTPSLNVSVKMRRIANSGSGCAGPLLQRGIYTDEEGRAECGQTILDQNYWPKGTIAWDLTAFIGADGFLYVASDLIQVEGGWVREASGHRWLMVVGDKYSGAPCLALRGDHTLWLFGDRGSRKTLDPESYEGPRFIWPPIQIGSDADWANARVHTFEMAVALKKDGTLWSWGRGAQELAQGLSATVTLNEPTQVGTDDDWVWVDGNYWSTFAAKRDGSLWAAGYHGPGGAYSMTPSLGLMVDSSGTAVFEKQP